MVGIEDGTFFCGLVCPQGWGIMKLPEVKSWLNMLSHKRQTWYWNAKFQN